MSESCTVVEKSRFTAISKCHRAIRVPVAGARYHTAIDVACRKIIDMRRGSPERDDEESVADVEVKSSQRRNGSTETHIAAPRGKMLTENTGRLHTNPTRPLLSARRSFCASSQSV